VKYNVLIIGYGYVGKAVASAFKKDIVHIVDPKYNNNTIQTFKNTKIDIAFVCVDTPKNENFKLLNSILEALNSTFTELLVCCKSTASPIFYKNAEKQFKHLKLVHSPEYLSHWNNIHDFINQKFIIAGGQSSAAKTVCKILKSRLRKVKNVHTTDIQTASLIKYSENVFLSLKVTLANELFLIHKKLKLRSTFKEFTKMLGLDERIGSSHLDVPGRDKKFGWGGHCFTKDIHEFIKFSKSRLATFYSNLNKYHRKNNGKPY